MSERDFDFKCDHSGCRLPALFEVYWKNEEGFHWSQLCLLHFVKHRAWRDGWCLAVWLFKIPIFGRIIDVLWDFFCRI